MSKFNWFWQIAAILILVSCNPPVKDKFTDTLTEGVIPITVDQTFEPIIKEEIEVFESIFVKAGISPIYTSEVDAINLLLKDSVRLAVTTRPLSSKEEAFLAQKKFQPHCYKIATDGIALIVNKQNKDTFITVDQFRQIATGKIKKWNQIYPGSNLGDITVVFDNPNSSTVRYVIDSICGGQKLGNLTAQNTNTEVINYVRKTPGALGIVGVSWLNNKIDTTNLSFIDVVNVMSVSNEVIADAANSYKPFQAYLFYQYYPLTRNVYVIVNDPRTSLPSGFTNFLTQERGQRIILKAGLVPATQTIRVVETKVE